MGLNCFLYAKTERVSFTLVYGKPMNPIGSTVFLCWFAGFVVSDLHLNVGYNDNIFLL